MTNENNNTEKKVKIYLAAGFFNPEQIKIVDFVEASCLIRNNIQLFSPRKNSLVTPGSITDKKFRDETFKSNCDEVDKADLVLCSTEGKDMGSVFEASRAYTKGIPVFYVYMTDNPLGFNLMLSSSATGVLTNYSRLLEFFDILQNYGLDMEKLSKFQYGGKVE